MLTENNFLERFKSIIDEGKKEDIYDFIEKNIISFFSSPLIFEYYQLIKNIDILECDRMLAKLIIAWLAFLSGDNQVLYSIYNNIDELQLKCAYEASLFYALKAFSSLDCDEKDRLKYSKLSIDILPKDDKSMFMGNAKLTYAQILAGTNQYRLSCEYFQGAYDIFYNLGNDFLAVVALTNKLIKKCILGEIKQVLEESNNVLTMSLRFKGERKEYYNLISLPLGICYFELNKVNLAVEYLSQANECIDKLSLFHMYGITEYYLFKAYYLLRDKKNLDDIKRKISIDFKAMNYKSMDILLNFFDIITSDYDSAHDKNQIEKLEVEYLNSKNNHNLILFEAICYLKIKNISHIISKRDLMDIIDKLKFIGNVSSLQLFLIFLSEIHYSDGESEEAKLYLKEAVNIYKEYNIVVNFYLYDFKCVSVLKNIDNNLFDNINKFDSKDYSANENLMLSNREMEILSLLLRGKTNEEISRILYISVGTVKWHLNNIYSKLGVKNRSQAIIKLTNKSSQLTKDKR